MKTHRMYRRQSRPEVPNILVLKPGVNYVPIETMRRAGLFNDPYKAPEQAIAYVDEIAPFGEAEFERVKDALWKRGHVSPAERGEQ